MIRAGIIGITGYTGEELLKLLSKHDDVKITGIYGRSSSEKRDLKDVYPKFAGLNLKVEPLNIEQVLTNCDIVFLALPHAIAFEIVPHLIDLGVKVIDLSADFRLKSADVYEKWYNAIHTAKDYIDKAIYGLSELNDKEIKNAFLVANPGCYPTSIILGCAPAIKNGFVDLNGIVIDSKSGISGAGRKSALEYFRNEYPNFTAYKIAGSHRHIPEIEQEFANLSGEKIVVSFTPHIMPVERGMLSTIYINLRQNIKTYTVIERYREFYKGREFVKILDEGVVPGIKDVVNTNFCEISVKVDERAKMLVIVSVIDNLVKGASGQAVQNMNLMFGLSETASLY
ncbi:MAG: N-acetyl-gamma-glutamyl-phosphate reductase [Endomicrobium sp.]|nr:N-acetyl-gamma-glutamyl-phosphate reductase [Endomicrobium sp.]